MTRPDSAAPSRPRLSGSAVVGLVVAGVVVGLVVGGADGLVVGGVDGLGVGVVDGLGVGVVVGVGLVVAGVVEDMQFPSLRGLVSAKARRAVGHSAGPAAVPGLMIGVGWRVMRVLAWLMPRAAGSRWLAEAGSCLYEAPAARRQQALGSYLVTAPQVIVASWARYLAQRIRGADRRRSPR